MRAQSVREAPSARAASGCGREAACVRQMVASQDLGVKKKLREEQHPAEKRNQREHRSPRRGSETGGAWGPIAAARRTPALRGAGVRNRRRLPRRSEQPADPGRTARSPRLLCLPNGAALGDPGGFAYDVSPGPCCLTTPLCPSPPRPLSCPAPRRSFRLP